MDGWQWQGGRLGAVSPSLSPSEAQVSSCQTVRQVEALEVAHPSGRDSEIRTPVDIEIPLALA